MSGNKTVRINNRLYDAVTGLPLDDEAVVEAPETKQHVATPATAVHTSTQRSKTLNRRAIKKPGVVAKRPQPGKHMDIARSGSIKRFAPHPVTAKPQVAQTIPDKPATMHPMTAKVTATKTKIASHAPATTKQIKDAAISQALATPKPKKTAKEKKSFSWTRRKIVVLALLIFLVGAALVTYLNLPNLSVAFASSRAGISASYPQYVPDGYGLKQPVSFKEGEVILTFASRGGAGDYTITQSRSSWDSSAVLENVVRKAAGDNYIINQEGGLTIYTYDSNSGAAWVNAGILYTIASDAPLSTDQMRRIATSL